MVQVERQRSDGRGGRPFLDGEPAGGHLGYGPDDERLAEGDPRLRDEHRREIRGEETAGQAENGRQHGAGPHGRPEARVSMR